MTFCNASGKSKKKKKKMQLRKKYENLTFLTITLKRATLKHDRLKQANANTRTDTNQKNTTNYIIL